jgi:mono/diheme cytochrome c family protein
MGANTHMMTRHHEEIPEVYAGLSNPVEADEESWARGAVIYKERCAICHGDYGNGDGPSGAGLDPAPSSIAHTSQMLSDGYLFWRVTEGGVDFGTGMLPFGEILSENERWDVINYVQALGRGQVQPEYSVGGEPFNQAREIAQRTEMLAMAIEQGVIHEDEAKVFEQVHEAMDSYLAGELMKGQDTGLKGIVTDMVRDGLVTAEEADIFLTVHDRLISDGLMK